MQRAPTLRKQCCEAVRVVAIALVLSAVFIPAAFIAGISGAFYRQFALTIAASTIISAIVSLTLSPALAALLLKPHTHEPDTGRLRLTPSRFRPFSRASTGSSSAYQPAMGG